MNSPVLDALSDRDRHRLLDRSVPRVIEGDETIHFAGERSQRMHAVTAGVFKFVARDGSGSETILGLAAPGDIVGDLPWIDGLAQPFDVVAATTSEIVGVDSELFFETVMGTPAAATALLELQATRLRWIYSTCLERSAGGVPARVAGRLLDLADMIGRVEDGAVEINMPLPQADFGRLAGVCRESACKTLRRFKHAGMVDYRGRRLRILRPDMLERIRCAGRA